jgi:hypothetical protein
MRMVLLESSGKPAKGRRDGKPGAWGLLRVFGYDGSAGNPVPKNLKNPFDRE